MKNQILTILSVFLMAFVIFSCEKESSQNHEFTIDAEEIELDGDTLRLAGQRQNIIVNITTEISSGRWHAKCPTNDLWLSYSKNSSGKLVITVDNNNTNNERESYVTVVLGDNEKTIIIKQSYIRVLRFANSSLTVGASQGVYTIPYITNIEESSLSIVVAENIDWVQDLSLENNILTLRVLKNSTTESIREATLYISGDGIQDALIISQNAMSGYPYFIPVVDLDFNIHPSYEIWDNKHNKKVGEIFKEYLFKYDDNNAISIVRESAIVAYPVNSSGELDITNGLVVTNGGSVAWNTNIGSTTTGSEMISSYVKGTLTSMPDTIYMAAGASRMSIGALELDQEDEEEVVILTFVPMTVRDQRSGPANNAGNTEEDYTYNVVKVGSQFWMQENLKTSRFADGTNIATNLANSEWMALGTTCSPGCLVTGTVTANTYIDANASSAASTRDEYGCQYNHSAIINETLDLTGSDALTGLFTDKVSISGWSVPTVAQFEILWRYIVQASSGAATDPMPELNANATGELANITGFSAKGSRSRGVKTGGYNTATYYKTMSYKYGISGIHETTMFRIDAPSGQTVFRQLELGTGAYVRCIRK